MLPISFRTFGGWSCILSGLLLFIAHFVNLFGESNEGTILGSSIVLAAHLIVIFALFAIYIEQATESKSLGLIGLVLSVLGTSFVSGIVFVEIAGFSGVNTDLIFQAPISNLIFSIGPLLFVIGMILIGITTVLTKKLSRRAGLFLILGTLIFVIASFVSAAHLWIEAIGAAFTGLGFVFCGLPMVQAKNNSRNASLSM
jgi:hypothetical protein